MRDKKVLLLVPAKSARGGITNYYYSLKAYFPSHYEYFVRGAREWPYRSSVLLETKRILTDLVDFVAKLNSRRYCLVQSSTSLGMMSVFRDGAFLALARLFGLKTIVFFRGWNPKVEAQFTGWRLFLFKRAFFSCDHVIVLSSAVAERIRAWGYRGEVSQETTLVNDSLLDMVDSKAIPRTYQNKITQLLFLGRIERTKGIFELLSAFIILQSEFPELKLVYAGDGRDEEALKYAVRDSGLSSNVSFLGYVDGKAKQKAFMTADMYVFPTYSEGMPNSVLEAMAFGLPVYTRPVGGIPDIIAHQENGILEESLSPEIMASKLAEMIANPEALESMSKKNHELACSKFLASKVASRLVSIHNHVLNK